MIDIRIRIGVMSLLISAFLTGCNHAVYKGEMREPYEGFVWEHVSGAGLDFMAQRNDRLHVATDASLPGAVLMDGDGNRLDTLMRVFRLEHGTVDELPSVLCRQPGWDEKQTCKVKEVKPGCDGRRRYVLLPDGAYADSINMLMENEPVPSTCSGWGIGNSGFRYFEVFSSAPGLVLFVEIGQEMPLFDECSIRLSDVNPADR